MIEEYSINENMSDLDLIFHSVSKENVVRQNIDTTNLILENLRKNTTKSKKKLMITFDGYDNDKREVYEIDEIRKYVKKVFEKNHDLFYYLTSLVNNDSIILACLGNLTNIRFDKYDKTMLKIDTTDEIRRKIISGVLDASKLDEKVAKEIIKNLFNYDSWEV